jgi:hypothetical protein
VHRQLAVLLEPPLFHIKVSGYKTEPQTSGEVCECCVSSEKVIHISGTKVPPPATLPPAGHKMSVNGDDKYNVPPDS